jgi:(1->4)-alpha-D-glucan 1-alpha-D-glucosylmutase
MPPVVPLATYRIQFTKNFGFDDAAKLAPYLKQLGISHLYASPFLKARPGSTHGYDIVDHDRLNPELGGDEAFRRMSDALKANGLGLILDFVPNHMGVGRADNAWWLDVLEWGQKSPHAASFDIDWDGLPHRRHPGVLLPILGRPYGDALNAGEIELKYDAEVGSFAAWYFEHKLPINPQRYSEMLRTLVGAAGGESDPVGHQLLTLAHEYRDPNTPSYRDAAALKQKLAAIKGAATLIERGLVAYRGDNDAGAALLHRLLERQHYRLAYWRIAFSAVNYRRFFDINELAGLRVENAATFRAIHSLVGRLIAEDRLQGLRLDHIDGLRDPARYTAQLQRLVRKLRRQAGLDPAFYIIVEKILREGEPMPQLPGIDGTTGYEWLNTISRVLVDAKGLVPLEQIWRDFTGEQAAFETMLENAKHRVINTMLASEFTVLANALARIAAGHYSTRDFTLDRLRAALQAYVIEFPVYRSYVTAAGASDRDRALIDTAIERARARWRGPDPDIFGFLRDAITTELTRHQGYSAPRVRNFALKLQQFTGPLMAKALEDTTFYRHHRLLALNEVGGDPAAGALSLSDFVRQMAARANTAPAGLTATATHDTKRGEDARMRILALAEMPAEWDAAVRQWRSMNAHLRQDAAPSAAHEYMLYQALIGAWPGQANAEFADRMAAYALKAAREGKEETSWTNPNEAYEKALDRFVRGLLDPARSRPFLGSFGLFASRTALLGALNSLSQLALKILMPGVPDFYQGTEFWDLSLVDPDNRRPVDFALRQKALGTLPDEISTLTNSWVDGRIKLALMHRLLRLRYNFHRLFARGTFQAAEVQGPQADHVIAFTRAFKRDTVMVVIGRHFFPLTDGGRHWPRDIEAKIKWDGSTSWENLLDPTPNTSIDALDLAPLTKKVPVAVLRAVEAPPR